MVYSAQSLSVSSFENRDSNVRAAIPVSRAFDSFRASSFRGTALAGFLSYFSLFRSAAVIQRTSCSGWRSLCLACRRVEDGEAKSTVGIRIPHEVGRDALDRVAAKANIPQNSSAENNLSQVRPSNAKQAPDPHTGNGRTQTSDAIRRTTSKHAHAQPLGGRFPICSAFQKERLERDEPCRNFHPSLPLRA